MKIMKTIGFEHINEKQKANRIDLSELKDIKIDDNEHFKKSSLKTFDIVKFNNMLYMVFANKDVHQFRHNPFHHEADNGIFIRYDKNYDKNNGFCFMCMAYYDDNITIHAKYDLFDADRFDVKEIYIYPGNDAYPDSPSGEPVRDLHMLTQERLESIIKDFKYKHFVRQ